MDEILQPSLPLFAGRRSFPTRGSGAALSAAIALLSGSEALAATHENKGSAASDADILRTEPGVEHPGSSLSAWVTDCEALAKSTPHYVDDCDWGMRPGCPFGSDPPGAGVQPAADPEARYYGGKVERFSLVPMGDAQLGKITLADWVKRKLATRVS
jgi:hypothetical protein